MTTNNSTARGLMWVCLIVLLGVCMWTHDLNAAVILVGGFVIGIIAGHNTDK